MKDKVVIIPGWSGSDLLWQQQLSALDAQFDAKVQVLQNDTRIADMAKSLLKKFLVNSTASVIRSVVGWRNGLQLMPRNE